MFISKINPVLDARPQLTCVWINTGDPRMPLKAVWVDETKLRSIGNPDCMHQFEDEAAELTDDHLCLGSCNGIGWQSGPGLGVRSSRSRPLTASQYWPASFTGNRTVIQCLFPRKHT
jgi:hypothetical protein